VFFGLAADRLLLEGHVLFGGKDGDGVASRLVQGVGVVGHLSCGVAYMIVRGWISIFT
jgi:hypothetical protein